MGTLGERRQAEFDALYAEAKQALAQGANQLRAVTERLRQAYAESVIDFEDQPDDSTDPAQRRIQTSGLARDKSLLARLEVAVRDIEQSWLFLERGMSGAWQATGRWLADEPEFEIPQGSVSAMRILEAQEAERAHVAEELHEGPAQALANAVFQVDIIDRTLTNDPPAARDELLRLRGDLERELERMRGFIHQLHPSLRSEDGLESAIDELAERLTAEDGIEVDLQLAAPADMLDLLRSTAVLRVTQEALRNVRKHAAATRVRLSTFLESSEDGLHGDQWVLEIVDNGRGFVVDDVMEHASKRHFGLRFMRERAQLIGARLEIVSKPAAGTTVRLALEPAKRS